ncbi:thiol reductant ABC exporter subunit CydD [Skermanella pratensis]|uniref:thiol reductant ABC exporter subunit CydD n=1 Tax=Skermanella pratensis TaxID=2233999 RepID=UPI001B3B551E|nr:thiol reductant ABC exporter subunit CydD [Skermanella pratensis]
MTDRQAAKWLGGLARQARLGIGLAVGAGFASGVLLLVQAGLIAHVLHAAIVDDVPRADLMPALWGLLAVYGARAVCAWGAEVAGFSAAARVRSALRRELYGHIARLGPAYAGGRHSGDLSTVLIEQVDALDGYFARFLPQMALSVLVPLTLLAAIFPVNWVVGGMLLLAAPFVPLFMSLIGMGAAAASRRQFEALARMGGYFLDRLQGLTTLKLFGQARRELDLIGRVSDEYRQRTMGVLRIAFLSSAVLELFSAMAVAVVAVYVGFSLLGYVRFGPSGDVTLATGMFVLLLAPEFFLPLRQLAAHYHDRAAAVGAAGQILAVLDTPAQPPAGIRAPAGAGPMALEMTGVEFAHGGGKDGGGDGARPVLSGFSLTVGAGERVALVGPSGAGKSTVIGLFLGFLRPGAGSVRIGGLEVGRIDPADLTAWVGQNPHLFHGTIRDNIRLARPDASDEAVEAAADAARVSDFAARLPDGLDTLIGQRGHGISGGEARRVALARAYLKDAPVLLLDEPTAGLDAANEALVLEALGTLALGRTVLIATHSLSGIGWAERRVEIGSGRMVAADA